MNGGAAPCAANRYHAREVERMLASLHHWSGRWLEPPSAVTADARRARRVYHAPYALLAHDSAAEPRLTYANLTAQRLFGMTWAELIGMPSRETAEAERREARAEVLQRVARQGFAEGYSGIRIGRGGRRFRIEQVTLWNLREGDGGCVGQAALIEAWHALD